MTRQKILLLMLFAFILAGCSDKAQGSQRANTDKALKDIHLSGFMSTSKGTSVAIINGKVVKEGDVIEDFTIKTITQDYVLMIKGGKEYKVEPTALTALSGTIMKGNFKQSNSEEMSGSEKSLDANNQNAVYVQSVSNQEESIALYKKREYLTLAQAHERQAYALRDFQQAFYHVQEAINNYKNALSLEKDRQEQTDIEFKIERLEDQVRVINNSLNKPASTAASTTRRYIYY